MWSFPAEGDGKAIPAMLGHRTGSGSHLQHFVGGHGDRGYIIDGHQGWKGNRPTISSVPTDGPGLGGNHQQRIREPDPGEVHYLGTGGWDGIQVD